MEFFQFSFDCLTFGDLIALIFIYEATAFLFTLTSGMLFNYLMEFKVYRDFMAPSPKKKSRK